MHRVDANDLALGDGYHAQRAGRLRAAIASGELVAPGPRPPFIEATVITAPASETQP